MSIVLIIGMLTIALIIFIPIFSTQSYYLDIKAVNYEKMIESYSDQGNLSYGRSSCPGCPNLSIREALGMIDGSFYAIITPSLNYTNISCSNTFKFELIVGAYLYNDPSYQIIVNIPN